MTIKSRFLLSGTLFALVYGIAGMSPAYSDPYRHGRPAGWNRGHWQHDRHGGRLGWWWVVGPSWYYYQAPHSFVVIQQPAQPIMIQQAPPVAAPVAPPVAMMPQPAPPVSPVLYYCKATGTHYPETMTCPGGWSMMTAETPPQQ
jgi:hypothetical protein